MKKAVLTLIVLLLPLVGGAGDHNTDFLLGQLDKTSEQFAEEIAGLTEEQWRFKADENTWSIAECAQHIVLTEGYLRGTITGKVLATPAATSEQMKGAPAHDGAVMAMIVDRSFKAKAPEPVQPIDVKGSPADLKKSFMEAREETVAVVQAKAGVLRKHIMKSPVGQEWDGYQWTLFLSGHTERHVKQMREVKSHPQFPK